MENKIFSNTYRKDQLTYKKAQVKFFKTNTRIQSKPGASDESGSAITFLTILGVTGTLCSLTIVLKGKASTEISESSILRVLRKDFTTQL